MLLFYAAHHHAQMASLNHHAHSLGFDGALDGFSNLHRESLLYLQAAGKDIYQAGDLAQSYDFPIRNVGHVDLAEERENVMLAEAEHFDVFDDDHLVVAHVK